MEPINNQPPQIPSSGASAVAGAVMAAANDQAAKTVQLGQEPSVPPTTDTGKKIDIKV